MLIDSYDIEISAPACDPTSEFWVAKLAVEEDLTEVLPYMNAVLEKGFFDADNATLVWKVEGHNYAMRPHEIAINRLDSREHAYEMAEKIVALVNDTWEQRAEITPDFSKRVMPKVLEVFKLLPRTNCRECGLPTCMAYAAGLIDGAKCLEDCPGLAAPERVQDLAVLIAWGL